MPDCTPQNSQVPTTRRPMVFGLLLLGLVLPALLVDAPLVRWIQDLRGESSSVFILVPFELAARALGAMAILLLVAIAEPTRRRDVARVAASVFLASLLTLVLKYVFARERPFLLQPGQDALATFQGLFATLRDGSLQRAGDRMFHSFPSGHVTTAAALCFGLSWLYPRARWWLLAAVSLVAVQRIAHLEHYLSDTLAGAAVGLLAARLLLTHPCLDRLFAPASPAPSEPS